MTSYKVHLTCNVPANDSDESLPPAADASSFFTVLAPSAASAAALGILKESLRLPKLL